MKEKRALIGKYIQGKCTPDELAFLREWIQTEEAGGLMEEMIGQHWSSSEDSALSQLDSHQLFEKINGQLPKENEKMVMHKLRIPSVWKYVAILLILILSGVFFAKYFSGKEAKPLAAEEVMFTKEVERRQKRSLTLTDGTRVVLNAESSFSFPEHFSDTLRLVYLEGEAFFEVTKDNYRPFIVKTPTVETRVLGTSFNIRAYPADTVTNVALVTGKIVVQEHQRGNTLAPMLLEPGEMAVYHKTGQVLTKTNFDIKTITGWIDGILYFQEADYTEITRILSRWYDVTFDYRTEHTPQWQYNGEFKDKSLEYVLESISYACKFRYSIQGKQVVIDQL